MIAALYVQTGGCYFGLPDVDPWDKPRDARRYAGPHPVVAHPPCERWGRFWHGSTRRPHQFKLGDDDGCFEAALTAVRRFGGVLEHPADSHAWAAFCLNAPPRGGRWVQADFCDQPAYGKPPPCQTYRNAYTGEIQRMDGRYSGYVPALACPGHGGPPKPESGPQL